MAIPGNKKVAIPNLPRGPIPDPASRKEGVPFHNLFNFSRVRTPGKSITGVLEKPVLKDSRQVKADPAVVRNWVAMEEKIVHDHKAGSLPKIQEKKGAIIRPNVPGVVSSKQVAPPRGFFNFSKKQVPSNDAPKVLSRPLVSSPQPKVAKADPVVVRNWGVMEEKIAHDHKTGPLPKIQEKKGAIIRPNVPGAVSSKQVAPSRGFFNFSKKQVPSNDIPKVLSRPAFNSPQPKVAKPDLKAVASWVAMEEKIVQAPGIGHDQKQDEKKLQKIKIVRPQVQRTSASATSKGKAAFGGLFSFLRSQPSCEKPSNISKDSSVGVTKSPLLDVSQVNVAAVKKWVASEEAVVHGYKEQKTLLPKDADLSPRVPPKQVISMPESLKTQTTVRLAHGALSAQEPVGDEGIALGGLRKFLWVLGWLVAGTLVFLYAQAMFLSHQADQKNARLESENKQLEQSYAALKSVSDDQAAEMIWLRSQLQDMTWELKDARSEMVTLRNTVRTKDEIVQALKAQTQALEMILSQQRAAVLPTVADVPRERHFAMDASVVRGFVSSINDQQGFVVINIGSSQGVHSGQWVMMARSGKELAVGRIDRVYPTMSVAKLRDKAMFQRIREGDSVYFS